MDEAPLQLSQIERLPSEIKVVIMQNVDIESISKLALASPILYADFKLAETLMAYDRVQSSIDPRVFPLAVARYIASLADWGRSQASSLSHDELGERIYRFSKLFLANGAKRCTVPKKYFTLPVAKAILDHQETIELWTQAMVRSGALFMRLNS